MASITIRNLPDSILSRIRTISELEKQSLNSELLLLIERGLSVETEQVKESQIKLWESLSGQWEDERSTDEIIDDIYAARTMGRDINRQYPALQQNRGTENRELVALAFLNCRYQERYYKDAVLICAYPLSKKQ